MHATAVQCTPEAAYVLVSALDAALGGKGVGTGLRELMDDSGDCICEATQTKREPPRKQAHTSTNSDTSKDPMGRTEATEGSR